MTITLEKLNELKVQLEQALRNVENLICLAHYEMESDSTDTDYESECENERYFPLPDELPPMPPTLVRQTGVYLRPPSPKTPLMERYPPINIDEEELPPPIVLPQPQKKYKKGGHSSPI